MSNNQSQTAKGFIVVLGAGESGTGAAILAKEKGYDVFVSDFGTIKEPYRALLDQNGIKWEDGQHTEELILKADEVIKSPGIPLTAPLIQKLQAKGTPIISEIEFAARYTNAKMICITGSNGKTTTTSLIYYILRQAGLNVGLAGNIGNSLALQVAHENHDYYVIELSSFQLDNMYDFRADVAILLNITPDHLDRYDFKFQNYVDAKFRNAPLFWLVLAPLILIFAKEQGCVSSWLRRRPMQFLSSLSMPLFMTHQMLTGILIRRLPELPTVAMLFVCILVVLVVSWCIERLFLRQIERMG